MHILTVLLTCSACVSCGRRVQSRDQEVGGSAAAVRHKPLRDVAALSSPHLRSPCANKFLRPLKELAVLLGAISQRAAFNPSGMRVYLPVRNPSFAVLHPTAGPCLRQAIKPGRLRTVVSAADASTLAAAALAKEASTDPNLLTHAHDVGTAVIETEDGLVLVTGGSSSLAHDFVESVFGHGAEKRKYLSEGGDLTSVEKVDALLSEVARIHAGKPIVGLAHFGQGQSKACADLGTSSTEGASVLDCELRSLVLLVGQLVPKMRMTGIQCRILTVSNDLSMTSPSSWLQGTGMKALVTGFVEQYTEALGEELHGSNVTVYGMRIPADTVPELHFSKLRASWGLPSREVHGRILDIDDPGLDKQGGNVIGPSIDSRWAIRTAASQTADYPSDYLPRAYSDLAEALNFKRSSLVWFHGASDVLVRVSNLAADRQLRGKLPSMAKVGQCLMQEPSWNNAKRLMRAGGLDTREIVPYPDPWAGTENCERFWQDLEKLVLKNPPAMVYLVDPHFPAGHKTPDLSVRLTRLLEKTRGKVLFAVDQTYLGFTNKTEDDAACEVLALSNDALVLVRSLSKVEGLAALRLGYVIASEATASELRRSLPFNGELYVSELALNGALAAVRGNAAGRHRESVMAFYETEKEWLGNQLTSLGFHVSPSHVGNYFVARGPSGVIHSAMKRGAVAQSFEYPSTTKDMRPRERDRDSTAVFLVCRRATNMATVEAVRNAFQEETQIQEETEIQEEAKSEQENAENPPFGGDFMEKMKAVFS